ncbi:hypothetical protein CRUP_031400 [Coryphaenoides rupestris]|nr:hypothetical protein CRUP_031400 [Coryphaenoides rupestris]
MGLAVCCNINQTFGVLKAPDLAMDQHVMNLYWYQQYVMNLYWYQQHVMHVMNLYWYQQHVMNLYWYQQHVMQQYDIFTAPTTATYLIHGEVRRRSSAARCGSANTGWMGSKVRAWRRAALRAPPLSRLSLFQVWLRQHGLDGVKGQSLAQGGAQGSTPQ